MERRIITDNDNLQVFKKNPLEKSYSEVPCDGVTEGKGQPNTALLSTILVLGTFFVAFYMRKFRTSYFFGKRVCDFHVFNFF